MDGGLLDDLLGVVIRSGRGALLRRLLVEAERPGAGPLLLLRPRRGRRRGVGAASAGFRRGAFSRPRGFAALLFLR